jgi:hypothetical protein
MRFQLFAPSIEFQRDRILQSLNERAKYDRKLMTINCEELANAYLFNLQTLSAGFSDLMDGITGVISDIKDHERAYIRAKLCLGLLYNSDPGKIGLINDDFIKQSADQIEKIIYEAYQDKKMDYLSYLSCHAWLYDIAEVCIAGEIKICTKVKHFRYPSEAALVEIRQNAEVVEEMSQRSFLIEFGKIVGEPKLPPHQANEEEVRKFFAPRP